MEAWFCTAQFLQFLINPMGNANDEMATQRSKGLYDSPNHDTTQAMKLMVLGGKITLFIPPYLLLKD
jgi:hypothetical protein